jgi:hypothetical protein
MKTLKLLSAIGLLSFSLVFTSCNKNCKEDISSKSTENQFAEPLFQINDLNEIDNPDVMEADEINEFKLRDASNEDELRPCEKSLEKYRKEIKERNPDADPKSLIFALKQLDLDSAQKHSIRGLLKDYCECLGDHHRKAIEINKEAIKKANETRKEWVAAYKNGRITKAELLDKLKGLHQRIKEDLGKDTNKRTHIELMRKCQDNLFRSISLVLDATQKDKFHRWVENHK